MQGSWFFLAKEKRARIESDFVRIKCPGCGNEQIAFSRATTKIKCLACNKELADTGASKIMPKTREVRGLE